MTEPAVPIDPVAPVAPVDPSRAPTGAEIMIFAPDGIGEITSQSDLAGEILAALAADDHGPLVDGDILVVTSKIISKLEGCVAPAEDKPAVLQRETVRTVARRGRFAIVETRHGLVQAAAGIDSSNVSPELILTLPIDPDASAVRLHRELADRTGRQLGVIISDTSGRAWRIGQTDHAIGLSGVRGVLRYRGATDAYGNPLQVTAMAVADELAGAADLVKSKLGARPIAVIRGLSDLVTDPDHRAPAAVDPAAPGLATLDLTTLDPPALDPPDPPAGARELMRPVHEDLFRLGTRESVIEAVAVALGLADRTEDLFTLPAEEITAALTDSLDPTSAGLVRAMIEHACRTSPSAPGL